MKLSEYAIHKPITTVMITLSIVVLGFISLFRLPLEYAPSLTWPAMYINVSYPSSSPEEVERSITRPIEEVMGTLSHLKSISSNSYATRSSVRIEFELDTDMDLVAVHVRDRLDQVRNDLPDDVDRIEIRRWNTDDWPVVYFALTWLGDDPSELVRVCEHTIVPRLQRLQGVGNVEVRGLAERALLVDVDQNLLNTHGLDIRALSWALRSNNVNVSAGYVSDADRKLAVRSVGEFEHISQIRELPLRKGIEIGDVADVSYDYPEKKSFERLDGRDAVTVQVRKSSTANLVATVRRARQEMDDILEDVGRGKLRSLVVRDRSIDVTDGVKNLSQSAALGGILAISIIFVFLRSFRSTLIIGSAIPISVLCVFMIMYLMRQFFAATITLNLVSMIGLMVAVGMLVDPAVVALENIYRKRYGEGQDAYTAAIEGSREIGMPVLTASLTTICVFVPLIFITASSSSLWMRDFALTVCISIVAALCIALTLIPLAASRAFREDASHLDSWLKGGTTVLVLATLGLALYLVGPRQSLSWVVSKVQWLLGGLTALPARTLVLLCIPLSVLAWVCHRARKVGIKTLYTRIVNTTLRYRWTTLAVASIFLAYGYYLFGKVETQRYRWQPTRRVDFGVEVPRSYDVADALDLFARVEDILIERKEQLDIEAVSTTFSDRRSNRMVLYLVPADRGKLSTDEVQRKVTQLLPKDIPGVRFKAGRSRSSAVGVGVEIKGRNPEVLAILAEDVKLRMEGIAGVHQVETSLESGLEEIRVTVNRLRARRYGLSPRQIATTIATSLGTRGSSKFKTADGEVDITVQLKEEDRANLEQLKNTVFESDAGNLVSFGSLADFRLQKGPRSIERQDRMSTAEVFANTEQTTRFRVGKEMMKRMQQIPLPEGYSWQMDRRFRWIAQEQSQDHFTMIFAALLIYLIMAALFESYVHPFTIMFSISFAFTGVAFSLYSLGVPMDSNAYYGLLILYGIVVNNGIVLIDQINRYRRQGLPRQQAIVRGGQDRLRPIAMTAATTILGLAPLVVPMIYGTAEGSARRWGPIGLVVVSGLMVSTLLTLIILPTVYSLMDDLARYARRVAASARAT